MAQLIKYWNTLKGSYWFIPTVMSIAAAILSFVLTAIDSRIGDAWVAQIPWIYSIQAEGARGLLRSLVSLGAVGLVTTHDLALADMAVYWAMQLSLLGSAVWFWRAVLGSRGGIAAVLWSLAGLMQMGALGALLTFAPEPLYAAHALAPLDWGLTPLADQQLGGLIMWVPAMLPYLAMIALAGRQSWRATAGQGAA